MLSKQTNVPAIGFQKPIFLLVRCIITLVAKSHAKDSSGVRCLLPNGRGGHPFVLDLLLFDIQALELDEVFTCKFEGVFIESALDISHVPESSSGRDGLGWVGL